MTAADRTPNCPTCGRFMENRGAHTNDEPDSWEDRWACTVRHPTEAQKRRAAELVTEAREANRERDAAEMRALFAAADRARRQAAADRGGRTERIEAVTRDLWADVEYHDEMEET